MQYIAALLLLWLLARDRLSFYVNLAAPGALDSDSSPGDLTGPQTEAQMAAERATNGAWLANERIPSAGAQWLENWLGARTSRKEETR